MKPAPKKLIRVAVVEKDPLRLVGFRALFDADSGFVFESYSSSSIFNARGYDLVLIGAHSGSTLCEIMAGLKGPNGYYGTGLRPFLVAQRLGRLDTALTYHRTWEAGLEGTRGSPPSTLTFLYENHCESTGYYPISQPLRSLESNQPGASKPRISREIALR